MNKTFFTILCFICYFPVNAQDYQYTHKLFDDVTVTSDVVYATAPRLNAGT